MTWSFPIGRLFGTELRVHATFFLLLLWIGAAAYMEGGTPAAVETSCSWSRFSPAWWRMSSAMR